MPCLAALGNPVPTCGFGIAPVWLRLLRRCSQPGQLLTRLAGLDYAFGVTATRPTDLGCAPDSSPHSLITDSLPLGKVHPYLQLARAAPTIHCKVLAGNYSRRFDLRNRDEVAAVEC